MKKSTEFLKENFRDKFSRECNYQINGRKLATLLDGFTEFVQKDCDLLDQENRILTDNMLINATKIKNLQEEKEATDVLLDTQSEIIMSQTTDLITVEGSNCSNRGWAILFGACTAILASYVAYYVLPEYFNF